MLHEVVRDKLLTEAMGGCWHEKAVRTGIFYACDECGGRLLSLYSSPLRSSRSDFSTPEEFFKLWNWAIKQDWWPLFNGSNCEINLSIIHPDRFADAVYEFLRNKRCVN